MGFYTNEIVKPIKELTAEDLMTFNGSEDNGEVPDRLLKNPVVTKDMRGKIIEINDGADDPRPYLVRWSSSGDNPTHEYFRVANVLLLWMRQEEIEPLYEVEDLSPELERELNKPTCCSILFENGRYICPICGGDDLHQRHIQYGYTELTTVREGVMIETDDVEGGDWYSTGEVLCRGCWNDLTFPEGIEIENPVDFE